MQANDTQLQNTDPIFHQRYVQPPLHCTGTRNTPQHEAAHPQVWARPSPSRAVGPCAANSGQCDAHHADTHQEHGAEKHKHAHQWCAPPPVRQTRALLLRGPWHPPATPPPPPHTHPREKAHESNEKGPKVGGPLEVHKALPGPLPPPPSPPLGVGVGVGGLPLGHGLLWGYETLDAGQAPPAARVANPPPCAAIWSGTWKARGALPHLQLPEINVRKRCPFH